MIVCPRCCSQRIDSASTCQNCGFQPPSLDGFTAWAPQLASQNPGFNSQKFAGLFVAEAEHFWFRARNELIQWTLKEFFPGVSSFLEIGCGTGFVLAGIAKKFPHIRLVGSEIYTAGLKYAAQRLPRGEFLQMDARNLPYFEEFDVVSAFDVLEHIEEDNQVLQNIHKTIKPGGGCLISVPQHKWLWSVVDVEACHKRRYKAKDIHAKILNSGFQILRSTSFVSLLFPIMALSRILNKKGNSIDNIDHDNGLKISHWLNYSFYKVQTFESALIKNGINFPIGGSRLIVARKI